MARARVRFFGLPAFFLLFAPPLAAASVTLEYGMDKLGGDYRHFTTGRDPEACRQACADDAMCKSYTFVKPGVKGPDAICFLKSSVPPSVANACCVSGAKRGVAAQRPVPTPRPTPTPPDAEPSLADRFNTQRMQVTRETRLSEIRALPDNATVRLGNGREMSAGRYKELADAFTAIGKAGRGRTPDPRMRFSRTTAPAQVQLRPGADLQAIARLPDDNVLQLPTGEKFTVGDLKRLSALQKARTGRSLLDARPSAPRARLEGPAIRVTPRMKLVDFADKPDSTILETPSGGRVTLGELRATYKKNHAGARR